jgi:hypothetical protein
MRLLIYAGLTGSRSRLTVRVVIQSLRRDFPSAHSFRIQAELWDPVFSSHPPDLSDRPVRSWPPRRQKVRERESTVYRFLVGLKGVATRLTIARVRQAPNCHFYQYSLSRNLYDPIVLSGVTVPSYGRLAIIEALMVNNGCDQCLHRSIGCEQQCDTFLL